VSWTGTDAGSGIQNFSIYVSDNGGPYSEWLTQSLGISATYSCVYGRSYAFYSIAQDNVGNLEGAKTLPDTSTIAMMATTTTVASSMPPANLGANITFTATAVPAAGSGVPKGSVIFSDGSTQLGMGTLDITGKATYSTANLAAGVHSIAGAYSGDSVYMPSTSVAFSQSVVAPGYSLSVTPTTLTIAQGQSAKATFTVTPVGDFKSQISFACSGPPAYSTCSFSPSSVTPDGTGTAVTSMLTISTDVSTASAETPSMHGGQRGRFNERLLASLVFGLPGLIWARRRFVKEQSFWVLILAYGTVLGLGTLPMVSCGGSGGSAGTMSANTPKGTGTITVTASSGSTNQSVSLTVTVQ